MPALLLLERWLDDTLRTGIMKNIGKPESLDDIAKQMIDLKAKGFEEMIRETDWSGDLEIIAARLSDMAFLAKILRNKDKLSTLEFIEAVSLTGFDKRKEDVHEMSEAIEEVLIPLGFQITEERNSLYERKTWFWATKTQKFVFLLEFRHGNSEFPQQFLSEKVYGCTLHFYPAIFPERILPDEPFFESINSFQTDIFPVVEDFEHLQKDFVREKGRWYFRREKAVVVRFAALCEDKRGNFYLADKKGNCLRISPHTPDIWTLVAFGFVREKSIFGTWDGEHFLPLSVISISEIHQLYENRFETP